MSLDVNAANQQLWRLARQSAALDDVERWLSRYRSEMETAWVGEEVRYYAQTIDALIRKCNALSESVESLRTDISKAVDEIIAEEEAEALEAASASASN